MSRSFGKRTLPIEFTESLFFVGKPTSNLWCVRVESSRNAQQKNWSCSWLLISGKNTWRNYVGKLQKNQIFMAQVAAISRLWKVPLSVIRCRADFLTFAQRKSKLVKVKDWDSELKPMLFLFTWTSYLCLGWGEKKEILKVMWLRWNVWGVEIIYERLKVIEVVMS